MTIRSSNVYKFILIAAVGLVVAFWNMSSLHSIVFSPSCPYLWHGGSPIHDGSCWCGKNDPNCLCTPNLAADAILEYHDGAIDVDCLNCQVILIKRLHAKQDKFAIPGGYVQLGESAEAAVIREMKEETNLTITKGQLEQFKLFSSPPTRDMRRQSATLVFRVIITSRRNMQSGDDAKAVIAVPLKDVLKLNLAFDHHHVFTEYFKRYYPSLLN